MSARIEVVVGRIERQGGDAVVNAANPGLQPGTGVDGALRRAAGPELTEWTSRLNPLEAGEAVMTPGFKLKAKWIIHTSAPVWFLPGEEIDKIKMLEACYRGALMLAHAHNLRSISFPCLGTGNYGWPRDLACDVAVKTCRDALSAKLSLARVRFCCFSEDDAQIYKKRLKQR